VTDTQGMELTQTRFLGIVLIILAGIALGGQRLADATSGGDKNQGLTYDPETKKYFIGGNAKFTLKQGDQNSLVDGIEVSLDGGDYQAYKGAIQFKDEGKHTIKFRAVNPVNNWSPVQFMEVFVDLTAPVTESRFAEGKSTKIDGRTFVQLGSTVTLLSQDNLSGVGNVEYSWDNKTFRPYSGPVTLEKSGAQTMYFRATDRVGNAEAARTVEFFADGNPPYSTIKQLGQVRQATINGKGYLTASDSVAFSIEANDDGSKVKDIYVSIDGGSEVLYKKPIYFLSEGPHTLRYYTEDHVGNKEDPKSLSIYTVSTAPTTTATAVGKMVNTGGINYATRQFQLKLDAKDNIVGLERIEYKTTDEKDFKPYLEPIRFKRTGLHSVSYRAVDRTGNVEPTRVFNVNISENAPETTLETAQPLVARNGISYSPAPNVVTLNVNNNSVGVEKTMVSINDGEYKNYAGPITLTADQKVYKISYKSVDKLGNEEKPKTVTYHMINTIPVVDLFISNGKNSEEQVRTNYFDQPGVKNEREPASAPAAGEKKPAKKSKK